MMPAFEGDEGQAHADIEGGEGGRPMTFTIQFTQFDGKILTEFVQNWARKINSPREKT